MPVTKSYDDAARLLARENAESESAIEEILLFRDPQEQEIRLVELDSTSLPADESRSVIPFYFAPDPPKVPYWMAIALILPDEKGQLRLPERWGEWKDAKTVFKRENRNVS
jgi:hypothetical protein